jgi:CheY-like chemotaxis protein
MEEIARRGLRVLCVDDNKTNQFVFRHVCKPLGFDLELADDGRAAVDAIARSVFDVVFMDIQMPVLSGPEATAIIRRQEAESGRRRTPIIAFSASAMTHQVREYITGGMDAHIGKPLRREELAATLLATLDRLGAESAA